MKKSDRSLDAYKLDRLLAALDGDRERAAESYLLLRRRLVGFFQWRGALSPDDCADEALSIAAGKMAEGEPIRHLPGYCAGIARMVLLAESRERHRFRPVPDAAAAAPVDDGQADDRRMRCLERCLAELPAESRQLILAYYDAEEGNAIAARKALARRLGIPLNSLRVRAHRIRTRLEDAVREMMGHVQNEE